VKINVHNKQKSLPISSSIVKKIVLAVITLEKQNCDEVSIYFVDTEEICALHEEFFNDASVTDCISFPMDEQEFEGGYKILGEVFVCPQTAYDYAQKYKKEPQEECILYIVHGLLHLMGYNDEKPKVKIAMRKAEKKHMLNLKKLNLLSTD
jgi:probable rRNA maturation factor